MTVKLPKSYENSLRQAADWLTGGELLPVDLFHICERLGVTVSRSSDVPARRAQIVSFNDKPNILLGSSRSSISIELNDRERFLVAHELGHLILYKEHNAKPLGKSEYWKHEQLCDSFAQWLLIPAYIAHDAATNGDSSAGARLNATCELERNARVPWEVSASSISALDQHVAFFKIADIDQSHLRVRFSTLPNKKAIHQKMERTSLIGKSLLAICPRSSIQDLDSAIIREVLWSDANSCAAVRPDKWEFRVAAVSSSASR